MQRVIKLLPLFVLVLTSCGSDDDPVSIEGAWARASAAGQPNGAVYFELTVAEDDTLLGASVSSSVAARAEVHEVVMADGMDDGDATEGSDGMGEMGDGAMTMRELDGGLVLAGGETVVFEPGGYHVMLLDLADPLETGEEIDVTLEFATADAVTVVAEVAESAP